ncbi:MAG: MFS transporter [Deltaproteobacteria bacterium]|nr:MFS transporter [Deltaproteobacteria bacterium]
MLQTDEQLKRPALVIAVLSSFITPFMGSAVNIILPAIGREFQADAVLIGWIVTAYLLTSAVALVPFGRAADIFGRKKFFMTGIGLYSLAALLSSLAGSVAHLILCQILLGLGSSLIFSTSMAILISVYPPQERGKVLGIAVGSVYIGLSLGPLFGGLLTQYLGWRSVYIANVPLGLIVIYLVATRLKAEWAEAAQEPFDTAGAVIYAVGIISLLYGLTTLPRQRAFWLIPIGCIFLWGFVRREIKTEYPVFDMTLFRANRIFAFSSLAAFIHYAATFSMAFFLSLYLQHIKGLSPHQAGLVLMAQPVVMAVFSPLAGRLSDRIEPRIVATIGMGITTLCLFLFSGIRSHTGLYAITTALACLGFGYALFTSPNTNAIMGSVEKKQYGIASGSVGTMRLLGMVFSMGVATSTFSIFLGRVPITEEVFPMFMKSVRLAFFFFGCLCLIGSFASLIRGNLR